MNFLTTAQAADKAQVHPRTILKWCRKGKIKAKKLDGKAGRWRITEESLERYLRGEDQ